jgi:hypothetical protein
VTRQEAEELGKQGGLKQGHVTGDGYRGRRLCGDETRVDTTEGAGPGVGVLNDLDKRVRDRGGQRLLARLNDDDLVDDAVQAVDGALEEAAIEEDLGCLVTSETRTFAAREDDTGCLRCHESIVGRVSGVAKACVGCVDALDDVDDLAMLARKVALQHAFG